MSGGSAARSLTIALARRAVALTRIVPVWDSGGSSRAIRQALGLMPVGDIRQALMTMAFGEGLAGDLVRFCNTRLSDINAEAAGAELDMAVSGSHPLLAAVPDAPRRRLLAGLAAFKAAVGPSFDARNGSLGNFVLAGLMVEGGGDIDGAIATFRHLTGIRDHVIPASRSHALDLVARLRDGRVIDGQHRITALPSAEAAIGIATVELRPAGEPAHPEALSAVGAADVIIYGPGSFFTSILPHLLMPGMAAAIAGNRYARKVFIANLVECPETRTRTVAELLDAFVSTAPAVAPADLIGEIIVDRQPFPAGKITGGNAYLDHGALEAWASAAGATVRTGHIEDVWSRGRHDGEALADALQAP